MGGGGGGGVFGHPALYRINFIRIVPAATINFSLAGVRLLIEDGFYLFWRDTGTCDKLAFQDYFSNSRDIMIEKQQQNQARDVFCHAFASNR